MGIQIEIMYTDKKGMTKVSLLPGALAFFEEGENIERQTEMISGKIAVDVVGYRPVYVAKYDWFPQDLLLTVLELSRTRKFYKVFLPRTDAKSGNLPLFQIDVEGGLSLFKMTGPKYLEQPMWHDITLRFTAQEVIIYD